MFEIERSGYFPLTGENVSSHVPSSPGIYLLAARVAGGGEQIFFTSQSDNLHKSLRLVVDQGSELHPRVNEYLASYECYFTFFVMPEVEYLNEAAKILTQTNDPILRLVLLGVEDENRVRHAV